MVSIRFGRAACLAAGLGLLLLPSGGLGAERLRDAQTALPESIVKERKDWGADLRFGADLVGGNIDQSIVNGSLSSFKVWDPYAGYLTGKVNLVTISSKSVRKEWNVAARADRSLSGPWKVFAFTTHARNPALLLDYRGQVGAGPWLDLETGDVKHGISVAVAYQLERFLTPETRRLVKLPFRYLLTIRFTPYSRGGLDSFFSPAVSDLSNFRASAYPYVETDVWAKLISLRLQLSLEYDSLPTAGVKKTDTELATQFALHLGE